MDTSTAASVAERLPRRDLWLLPLISVATLVLLLGGAEISTRLLFPRTGAKACEIADPVIGRRFQPFCSARMKSAEGPWVVNTYNDCGYRTKESCKRPATGTARIALLGSSVSEGLYVPFDETFAQRTAVGLSAACRRPVEVQNLGREACDPVCSYHRVDEVLALKPDLVVLALTPHDLDDLDAASVAKRGTPIPPNLEGNQQRTGLYYRLRSLVLDSRAATMAQHLLFRDAATYLRLYLPYKSHSGYLKDPLSEEWQAHLHALDTLLGEEAARFGDAHVHFVLLEVPNLAQASIVSMHEPLPGIDPEALNRRLREIAGRHGIEFVDVLPEFQKKGDSNAFFYVVDGHLNGDGQALVSDPLVRQLSAGASGAALECGRAEKSLLAAKGEQ